MKEFLLIASIILVIFSAGCTSAPVKEISTSNVSVTTPTATARYVELGMIDGTKVGGKYVSESASFTTIVPMYGIDGNGIMQRGNGIETGITTNLIATMVTIADPSSLVNATLNQQEMAKKERERELAAWNAQIASDNANASNHRT